MSNFAPDSSKHNLAIEAWLTAQVDDAQQVLDAVRTMTPLLAEIAQRMAEALQHGGKILLFGNGGSAADAQHWAAELTGRFYQNRESLPALALSTNTSQVTALANDFGYDQIFAMPLAALGRPGDVAIGLSTSGRSPNVLNALAIAQQKELVTVGFTGTSGDAMAACCDYLVQIPSTDVARIQEGHELCGHLLCAAAERMLFGEAA
ncbi:MAG TPA: SIS domain-containing protein [Rhodothermales bacterium]|nr:SIS domain-containing protein [Rhodothermales bacterium]